MTSNSYPGPSGSGLADTLTLDEVDGLSSAPPGALREWLLDESKAGRLSVSQREVPVVNPVMVRTFKIRGSSGAGRAHDTDLRGQPTGVMQPKPAPPAPAVVLTTEYRITKQAIGNLAPALLAKGWWREGLQRWTGVDPNPVPDAQASDAEADEFLPTKKMVAHLEGLGFANVPSVFDKLDRNQWLKDCRVSAPGKHPTYSKNKTVKAFQANGRARLDGTTKQGAHLRVATALGGQVFKSR